MLIEQPPLLYRLLFPEAIWRIKRRGRKVAYLTFDDGPIPEVTPWVLDLLASEGVKATFFLVGDNVRRNPELLERIKAEGHSYGNHTMHHLQGRITTRRHYLRDVQEAHELIDSPLFRPPHGLLRWGQSKAIRRHFNLVMYDLVTRDYSRRLNPDDVMANIRHYVRNGSIIVFHDSLKARRNLTEVLLPAIRFLKEEGYELLPIPM
ncbi:MAG: polysaccharide deacetylase family protein [Pseudoflavonifractor sp.]|nr:polysaccharide deacetylase family protein [Alloprevotella sp.]MCM1117139.1 polysaccharide deacetylase family protein [Pseudoflavonifractor sp.]